LWKIKHKLITAVKIRRKQRNENILADKVYDSEKNHELAEKYGAKLIVPLVKKTEQFYRKRNP